MNSRLLSFPETGSFFLFGPRQTGKTTLVRSRYPEAWYVNLLFEEVFFQYSAEPGLFRRQAIEQITRQGKKTVVIDEVQRIPELLNDVQALIDSHPDIRFVLTGSSARKLKRKGVNLLAGRAVERRLFPYVQQEMGDGFSLDAVLRFGSLPSIFGKDPETSKDLLMAYVNTYLREEIRQEGLIRNLGAFSRFLDIAASQNSELVSFSDMARECGISSHTIKSYYEVLEDTMIAFPLQAWSKSARKRMVTHPRYYFFDLGVVNALNRRLSAELDPRTKGRIFETFIVVELHRHLHYSHSEARLFFWRTSGGAEVDLVVEKHGRLIAACEIKTSRVIDGNVLSGIKSFKEDFPDVPCYIGCTTELPYEKNGVRILPWTMLIKEITALF
jgi:Predicted ATPase (AAA+ superfamily)